MRAWIYGFFILVMSTVSGVYALMTRCRLIDINFDPPADQQTLSSLLNLDVPLDRAPILAGVGFDLGAWITPPRLAFSYHRPLTPSQALLRRNQIRVVSLFDDLRRPINFSSEGLQDLKAVRIFTNDVFIFNRFKVELSNLTLVKSIEEVRRNLKQVPNSFGLMRAEEVPLTLRSISNPTPIEIWMGWEEHRSQWFDKLGLYTFFYEELLHFVPSRSLPPTLPVYSLVAVGDMMLDRGVTRERRNHEKDEVLFPFQKTWEELTAADLTTGNLECAVSDRGKPVPDKGYTFRANPSFVSLLQKVGFDLLDLANNHSKDFGSDALVDTLRRLHRAGIKTVGAGRNRLEAESPVILLLPDGTRVGFLGYTDILPVDFLANSKTPGVAWAKWAKLSKEIPKAKAQCDILVVQYHWGVEYQFHPNERQRRLAHQTIDWGADVVIGHHPHWIQEVEFYKNKFIAYSLGNFIFDMAHRPKVTEGLILKCVIAGKKIQQVQLDPVSIRKGEPEILSWDNLSLRRNRVEILKDLFDGSGFPVLASGL